MVLFLDYDGVMHEIGCTKNDLFRHSVRLAAVLRDHPDIDVVVSSDWRKDASVAELAAHFAPDVRNRFIGHTGIDSGPTRPRLRETQCWAWLCAHGREQERWIALEDCPDNFGPDVPGSGAVLFTDPSDGFDEEAAIVLRTMIASPTAATHFCYDRAYLRGWTLWP